MKGRNGFKFPKEHGAWAMLYVPMVVGVIVAGGFPARALLIALAVTAVFISRPSMQSWWRARSQGQTDKDSFRAMIFCLGLAAACGLPLILIDHLYGLIPLGAASALLLALNAEQTVRRQDRAVANEILAILGLTLTAPVAYYAVRGAWDAKAICLWAMCALFFASSVFYVRLRVYSVNARKEDERRKLWRACALYHSFLLVSLVALAVTGNLRVFALIAFAPALGRSFRHMIAPVGRLNLKKIGVMEIVYSIVFLIFIALSF
ncbi:MAG: YwiC-like family protein [Acidobacteriota bacterium]